MSEPAVDLPNGLDQAFGTVAGELGQATAAWLFVRAVARSSGDGGTFAPNSQAQETLDTPREKLS